MTLPFKLGGMIKILQSFPSSPFKAGYGGFESRNRGQPNTSNSPSFCSPGFIYFVSTNLPSAFREEMRRCCCCCCCCSSKQCVSRRGQILHMELSLKILTSKSWTCGSSLVLSVICGGEEVRGKV